MPKNNKYQMPMLLRFAIFSFLFSLMMLIVIMIAEIRINDGERLDITQGVEFPTNATTIHNNNIIMTEITLSETAMYNISITFPSEALTPSAVPTPTP